ncbi:MAG: PocR ligand-binding domain-containing protein [Spirochaetes bacterium]|nr:PocR ligand-binding domain-containing protein [Spirochaetota bacterium]
MQPCLSGGLWDGGASINVGEKHIANWLIGQIRNKDISYDRMRSYAREIEVDENEFMEALSEVREMTTEQFEKVCNALFLIANQISQLAYNNLRLKQSESSLRATLSSIADAVITTDTENKIVMMNPVAEKLAGLSISESKGMDINDAIALNDPVTGKTVKLGDINNADPVSDMNLPSYLIISDNGEQRTVTENSAPVLSNDGTSSGMVYVLRDETDRIKLETQLIHTQKMEAIGQLAGGVAHDFNNMLTGIVGAAEVIKSTKNLPDHILGMSKIILEASEKAASLTRSLLDFSRKGKIESCRSDIHSIIEISLSILKHSLDKNIIIEKHLNAGKTSVLGNAAQLQSSILNLGINSRDAMPEGGTLTVSTENIILSKEECGFFENNISPGEYILISIADTGIGMPPEVIGHIFEPFFTTKEVGKGTGLGLPSVYGTIRAHSGAIHVYSESGCGSIFKIYLPVSGSAADNNVIISEKRTDEIKRKYRILVVDDESIVREIITAMLISLGHESVAAANGEAALSILNDDKNFDLIILDVIMPVFDGRDTYIELRKIFPDVHVLFSSGFTKNKRIEEFLSDPSVVGFIQKPYRTNDLGEKITTLDTILR